VIEEWASAITARKFNGSSYFALTCDKETVELDSNAAPLVDGLTDDYELGSGDIPGTQHKDDSFLYVLVLWDSRVEGSHVLSRTHQAEAAVAVKGREVVILMSGAWKTWVISSILRDGPLTLLQVDVAPFLYLHQPDELRAPPDFCSWRRSGCGR
jgi:hypothetical protein